MTARRPHHNGRKCWCGTFHMDGTERAANERDGIPDPVPAAPVLADSLGMTPYDWARVLRAGANAAAPPTGQAAQLQAALEAMADEAAAIAGEQAMRALAGPDE